MADDDRSPEEIERDLARTRAQLDQTLDAIQSKLTPGELFEEGLTFFKQSGTGDRMLRTVRENPLPVLVIGVGLLWLLVAGSRRRRPQVYGPLLDHGDYRVGTSTETSLQSEPFSEEIAPAALAERPIDPAPPLSAETARDGWGSSSETARFPDRDTLRGGI